MPSFVQTTSRPGQVNYPISTIDGWLSPTFLKVYIDGNLQQPSSYTLQTIDSTPHIVLTSAPTTGSIVRIARETPSTVSGFQSGIVDFQDASILTAQDLDNAVIGLLHISQEGADTGSGALGPTLDGLNWDANSKKITAIAAPNDPGDAATKNYVDTLALYGKAQTAPQTWNFIATESQTNFNLSDPEPLATVEEMYLVTVNGVLYAPNEYSFSGSKGNINLVFNVGLIAGNAVVIRNHGVSRAVADAITPGSITEAYLGDNAVTSAKIASSAVIAAKIGAGAVTEAKLGDGSVNSDKLANLAVTTSKISNGAVTAEKLATEAVDTGQLAANAVTNVKIENNTISVSKLSTSVTVSSLSPPTSALSMNGQRITDLAEPTQPSDAATRSFVLNNGTAIPNTGKGITNFPVGTYLALKGNVFPGFLLPANSQMVPIINTPNNASNNVINLFSSSNPITLPWKIYLENSSADAPGKYEPYFGNGPSGSGYSEVVGTWVFRGFTCSVTGSPTHGICQRIA